MPVAHLLNERDATVTLCHSRTQNLPDVVKTADILVTAIGKPNFVQGSWLKPGVVIIDVGTNAIPGIITNENTLSSAYIFKMCRCYKESWRKMGGGC